MAALEVQVPDWDQVVAVLATIAAILAWIAKVMWSREYRNARAAEIQALRTRNETLEAISSKEFLAHAE
jgi:hypothetical protein